MFIDPGKVKRVEVNNENMQYYNNIYEQMRSEESKRKQEVKEQNLLRMQPSWFKRVFCCEKPIKREDIPLEEIVYSSGESGDEENRLGRIYLKMKERQKD